jgi:arsenite methyltransferase
MSEVREAVRRRYAGAALEMAGGEACCCGPGASSGCEGTYAAEELAGLGLGEGISLGCGNPIALAELEPGDSVLDLGSGGGLDVLLAARRVGPGGHAYGVDMTEEMLTLANRNRERAGIENATFLRGTIEAVPLPDASVDVVISNCVINLAEDKGAALREAFRVLKPGGRLAVADVVEVEELPPAVKETLDAWAGCVAGTIPAETYRQLLVEVGFEAPEVDVYQTQAMPGLQGRVGSAHIRARKSRAG